MDSGRDGGNLRILITNIGIANRTGTEIVAMDLARRYHRAGYQVAIWAPRLDRTAASEAIEDGVTVTDRLTDLSWAPDVIHGHHHLETIEAVRQFPGTPAIFVCHSGLFWIDAPPRHRDIRRFVGVDRFCRARLEQTEWLAPERIAMVLNAVDLERFRPREVSPSRPKRALLLSNYAAPGTHLEAVQEACRRAGLPLDCIGAGVGTQTTRLEAVLPQYDLVFAKARCALEAMAVGCAVILCDTSGLGGLVTSDRVAEMREWNFGYRLLTQPLDPGLMADEIARYDASDAAAVSGYIRSSASLDTAAGEYLDFYRAALGDSATDKVPECYPETCKLDIREQAAIILRMAEAPRQVHPRQPFRVEVVIENRSDAAIATAKPWPSLLSYRWLDCTGAVVVPDGFRSIVQPPILPGTEGRYPLHIIAPPRKGLHVLRATMVQEGWRWLDELTPQASAEIPVYTV